MSGSFDYGYSRPSSPSSRPSSRGPIVVLGILLAAGALAGAWYLYQARDEGARETAPPPAVAPPPSAEPAIRHPIEAARPEASTTPEIGALPPLESSDGMVASLLAGAIGTDALGRFVVVQDFVRRVVTTVDNLPRDKAAQRLWPVKATDGRFVTAGSGDEAYLSAANATRYQPFLRAMESADSGKLVAVYVKLYPLFNKAYRDLGYPNGHFNDRLVEVIDHLLATPEMNGPIRLAKPWVMYEYADASLESRSAGQKALLRMGPENASRVKAKLREIRRQVTGGAVTQ